MLAVNSLNRRWQAMGLCQGQPDSPKNRRSNRAQGGQITVQYFILINPDYFPRAPGCLSVIISRPTGQAEHVLLRRHSLDSRDPGRVGDVSSCSCCPCFPCAPNRAEYETRDLRCKRSPSLMKTASWSSSCIKSGVNPANGLAASRGRCENPSVAVSPGKPHVTDLATGPRKVCRAG